MVSREDVIRLANKAGMYMFKAMPSKNGPVEPWDIVRTENLVRFAELMNDWRPIETCDKSAVVIVWDDYYFMRFARYDFKRNLWITDMPYDDERGGVELPLNPTHWMPAPFPPKPPTLLDRYLSDPASISETKITDPIA